MTIRLKELLDGISAQVEGKRILAIECEIQDGFVTTEKLLVHLNDGTRIEIETGYVYDVKIPSQTQ